MENVNYTFINAPYINEQFDADKIFFTSDLHIGHANIIKYCNRPYADVQEMSEQILKSWNGTVPEDADVFILGDVFFRISKYNQKLFMDKLNGRKHLILGNHDRLSNLELSCYKHISSLDQIVIKQRVEDKHEYTTLVLSHYPLYSWAGITRGTFNLFGHEHNSIPNSEYLLSQMDVGWDVKLKPFSWTDICEAFTQRMLKNEGKAIKGF